MLAVQFTFPAGRYHATPWGRHVNEGEVAWPPEPWRLLRALIATWHHKVEPLGRYREGTLQGLIESLAWELPLYHLPPASHSHTRHYLPQWKAGDTSLVFDAFVVVDRKAPLFMVWPQSELPDEQTALLDDLLGVMGYLGRAESWVEARRVVQDIAPNCVPGEEAMDRETGELLGEIVELIAPVSADEYARRRAGFITDGKQAKKLAETLPEGLTAALSVDTADLQKQGWSWPPAARKVFYLRALDALRPMRVSRGHRSLPVTTARYLLLGKPLPRMEDAVRIGELLRLAIMGGAKRAFGEDAIPAVFSGHNLPVGNRHRHAFHLPWDADGDGRIDHLILHASAGIDDVKGQRVLERLNRIWSRNGGEWRLVLEAIGDAEIGGPLLVRARHWSSVTPYLHPWHMKKRFGVEDQIRRECRGRGWPEPVQLEPIPTVQVGGQTRRPIHFHRFRSRQHLEQPDRQGSFWRLSFPEPVAGPIALGFAAHFGLGLFQPDDPDYYRISAP